MSQEPKKLVQTPGAFAGFSFSLITADKAFKITPSRDNTKVWIEAASGEGGEFNAGELLLAIEKFYMENF